MQSEKLEKLVGRTKQAYARWMTIQNQHDKEEYAKTWKEVKTAISLAKKEEQEQICRNIDNPLG